MSRRASKRAGQRQAKKHDAGPTGSESSVHATILPPPAQESQRGALRGVFGGAPETEDQDHDALVESIVQLRPYYRESERHSERAPQLDLEDLSLRPDNPYTASALVPPLLPTPLSSPSLSKSMLGIAGAAAVAAMATSGVWLLWGGPGKPTDHGAMHDPRAHSAQGAPCLPPPICKCADASGAGSGVLFVPEPSAAVCVAPRAPAPYAAVASVHSEARVLVAAQVRGPTQTATAEQAVRRGRQAREPAAPSLPVPVVLPVEETPIAEIVPAPLPRLPTPREIKLAFEKIHSLLSECAGGRHGLLTIHATISHEGRIASAFMEGMSKSPQERECVARTVLTAQFPPFKQSTFKVSYPLAL